MLVMKLETGHTYVYCHSIFIQNFVTTRHGEFWIVVLSQSSHDLLHNLSPNIFNRLSIRSLYK